jgi:DNA-binding NtrC family response regulator
MHCSVLPYRVRDMPDTRYPDNAAANRDCRFCVAFADPDHGRMQNAEPPITTADVLVVDDDESVRHVVEAVLVNQGYAVETAPIEQAAITLLRCVKIRLIITSTFKPEGDNIEVLVAMKAHGVPIVAMSNTLFFTQELEDCVARQFGAVRVFTKPFRLQTLVSMVREIIGEPVQR